jgi:hypothetical protein
VKIYQEENAKHAKNGVFILSVNGSQSWFPIERLHAFSSVPCLLGISIDKTQNASLLEN